MSEPPTSRIDEAARPVPLVICVPPPKAALIGGRVIYYAVEACAFLILALAVGGWWWAALLAWAVGFVGTAWFAGRRSAAFNRRRTAFLERHEDWDGDPAAAALDRNWYVLSRPPPLEKVKRILGREEVAAGERAVIVCMAALDPPESGDMRFEPEVIKHKRPDAPVRLRHWWLVLLVILTAALLGSYIFPRVSRPDYVVGGLIALLAFGVWFWRYAVQTSYLRLAPGMIQILEFRPSSRRPRSGPRQRR